MIIILDADDDCPAQLGPSLLKRCQQVTKLPCLVVIANREIESWLLGSKDSLGGICGVKHNAVSPAEPEKIRGAKEHLTRNMEPGKRYLASDDLPRLLEKIDIHLTGQHCPSFKRFFQKLSGIMLPLAGG
ncbi:MAG: DUF4276 family protein [Deltaproteobacteria bacterium]|nr:DUF4276 family protein [Deltaproteobacteria bacterium]